MTNVLGLFQVSLAYKIVALQLMLGEANWVSQQLSLPTPHPIGGNQLREDFVGPPRYGVNGSLQTTNFLFTFWEGRLHTAARNDVLHKRQPLRLIFDELAEKPSLIDSNGAYQLSTQWLAAVSVDVASLIKKYPVQISQRFYDADVRALQTTARQISSASAARKYLPIYDVKWKDPNREEFAAGSIKVAILGSSKQLLAMEIEDVSFSVRPPLVITNAAELNLSSTRTPRARGSGSGSNSAFAELQRYRGAPPENLPEDERRIWMEKVFGRESAQVVREPEQISAYLLVPQKFTATLKSINDYPVRKGPMPVDPRLAKRLSDVLMDLNSYDWKILPYAPSYVVRLQFVRGSEQADVVFAFDEYSLQMYRRSGHTAQIYCRPAAKKLYQIVNEMFPNEQEIKRLARDDELLR